MSGSMVKEVIGAVMRCSTGWVHTSEYQSLRGHLKPLPCPSTPTYILSMLFHCAGPIRPAFPRSGHCIPSWTFAMSQSLYPLTTVLRAVIVVYIACNYTTLQQVNHRSSPFHLSVQSISRAQCSSPSPPQVCCTRPRP